MQNPILINLNLKKAAFPVVKLTLKKAESVKRKALAD